MKYERTNCLDCGKEHGMTTFHTASHQRKHKRTLTQYLEKYFTLKNDNPGFCYICASPIMNFIIDFNNKTYSKKPTKMIVCNNDSCKNEISMQILNKPYDKLSFSKIGSNAKYLALAHNLSIEEAKKLKYVETAEDKKDAAKSNIAGYVLRHGTVIGEKLYKERCSKIGYSNTLDWYLSKYGNKEGKDRYASYLQKLKDVTLGKSKSLVSKSVEKYLNELGIFYTTEYPFHLENKKRPTHVDFYLHDKKIVIEYFGDYWHANPLVYKSDYFHKTLKVNADEIWLRDTNRIDALLKSPDIVSVIVIWEGHEITKDSVNNALLSAKKSKRIYLQGTTKNRHNLWT